jgi:hypothetical protein
MPSTSSVVGMAIGFAHLRGYVAKACHPMINPAV